MAVLPQLPPADQDSLITITIPKDLVPYMEMIKPITAPNETHEQWLSRVVIEKGKEWLKTYMAQQIMLNATNVIANDLDSELKTLLGEK